jgi:hypothetical protein
MIPSGDNLKNA